MKSYVRRPHQAIRVLASKLTILITLVLLANIPPAAAQNVITNVTTSEPVTAVSIPATASTPTEIHAPFPVGNKISRNIQKYTGVS